jgi:AraC-like DNA-binding protein/tetratricopeptide (TPR) repeat protein
MTIKNLFLVIGVFLTLQNYSQKKSFDIPDSIQNKNYEYLFQRIEDSQKNSTLQDLYLQTFLNKAKSENNSNEIISGYKNYLHYSKESLKLIYADSMIYTAGKTRNNALIGSSYLTKGIVYYGMKKHKTALDNYLTANKYISQTNDQYLIHKVKYNIGLIKYYLGFYYEAISLFSDCMEYYKNDNVRPYLNSIHSLGLCYNKVGNYGLTTQMNEKGLTEGKKLSNNEMDIYFIHSEGVNQYFRHNYKNAIQKIKSVVNPLKLSNDFANESVAYFYIAKSYLMLNEPEMALPYLKKVDVIFEQKKYIRPDLIENYQLLIKYYQTKKDHAAELHYMKKLLKADSILDNNYKYLSTKIYKEYDSRKIERKMRDIEHSLEVRKYNDLISISIATLLLIALIYIFYRYKTNKKIYQRNFMELMEKNENEKIENEISNNSLEDINQETIISLLKKLEKFETNRKYLEKDLTLPKVAVLFNTNINYLYKIIYHYRGKKFNDYINDLKIDYIIYLLKHDNRYRNYTNTALAEEIGFSTTQRFAKAFHARTGVPTSYFIKEITKEDVKKKAEN